MKLSADGSQDPDNHPLKTTWFVYAEPGTYRGEIKLSVTEGNSTSFTVPSVPTPQKIHVILQLEDNGEPPLYAYRRAVLTMRP